MKYLLSYVRTIWLYLICLFILLTFRVTAQQFNVDSLRHTLSSTISDSERIVALNAMAMHYAGISLDTARKFVDQAFALAKKTGSESGQASCNNSLGWLKFVEGKNDTAVILIENGFKYYMRIHDLANSARAAQNLAEIFINQKDFVKALTWARKSADLQEDVGRNIGLLTAFKEIAIIYREMGNSDSSIHYFQKAIDLGESHNEKSYTSDAYVSMGILYLKQGKYDEGLAAFQHSYNLSESINRKMGMAMARENMGDAYSKMKKYPAALASYQYALDYFKSNNQRLDWGYENINVGNVYRAMGNYTASISSYREALRLFELVGSNTYLPDVYQGLSETYNLQGDYKNAFEAYKNYITLRDSIFSEEQKSKLAELTTQYESEKKDKAIQLLNKDKELKEGEAQRQRQLKNILIVGVLLLSLLAIVLVSRYQIKQRSAKELMEKNKIIEREKRRAEQSEQFKSTFLANMSHEIRTPMNAVMGMTNLLLDESQNAKNRHYLGVIKNASENLLVIINDILDLSKMEAGKMPLDNIPFRIREIVASVHDTLLLKADEKGLKLITDIDTHVPEYLVGDPARLTQVLLNLTGNAIKFTQTGSVQVTVECVTDIVEFPPGKKTPLRIAVSDTGIGIEPEKLHSIFESFTQAHTGNARRYGGTGLGLTISKNLVELFGGTLEAESHPGAGSVFSFAVPFEVSSSPEFEAYQLQKDGYSADDLFGLRILLAEDNEHNQLVVVDTLKKVIEDAEIIVATNGLEVLDLLNSKSQHLSSTNDKSTDSLLPFDIILMDVQMPELDGYETTRRIRTTLPSPLNQIPIIALTASVVRSDLKKCTEAGMNSYIAKPFSKDDLVKEIGKVLQRNTAIKERAFNAVTVINENSLLANDTIQRSYSPDLDNGVNFKQLYEICGDDFRARRDYLLQFLELVPARLKNLKRSLEENNRPAVRLAAHKLKPQLGFFGMRAEELLANRIEMKALKLSYDDMQLLIAQLEEGCKLAARAIGEELERS